MIRSTSEESDRDVAPEMRSHIRYHPLKSRSKAFVLASAVFSNTFIRKYGIFSVILCLGLGYLFYTRVLYVSRLSGVWTGNQQNVLIDF